MDTSNSTNVAMDSLTLDLNDSEYTVYLDKNGYVVGVDESGAAKIEDVYYVTGIARTPAGTLTSMPRPSPCMTAPSLSSS